MAARKIRSDFDPRQFTPTQFSTPQDKANGLEQLARFVEGGFQRSAFSKKLYHNLSLHFFGHIAHYDLGGFYAVWFSSPDNQNKWLRHASTSRLAGVGDPAYTWSDAEVAFQAWLKTW